MVDVKKLMSKVLSQLKSLGTTVSSHTSSINTLTTKTTVATISLSSSNWTASSASFTSGTVVSIGNLHCIEMTLKATQAFSAGTEYTLGTLKNISGVSTNMSRMTGIAMQGTVTGQPSGIIRMMPHHAISSGGNIYVRSMWII